MLDVMPQSLSRVGAKSERTALRGAASVSPELEGDIVEEIHRIGFHSFVLVRIGSNPTSRRSVYCRDQNLIPGFVHALAQVPRFGESLLVRGIEHALRREIYDAGDLLFRWMRGEGEVPETVQICEPDGQRIEALYNYPVFAFDCGKAPSGGDQRIEALLEMLDTYESTDGNNARRFSIMEAAALALGRALDARREYKQALAAVNKGLAVEPNSIHLKAAKHTLLLKAEGKPVSPRIEKLAGEADSAADIASIGDIALIERFRHCWKDNAHSYKRELGRLQSAARRLHSALQNPETAGGLTGDEKERVRSRDLERAIACLARQPLFFPEMFHAVTVTRDGEVHPLDRWNEAHFREAGLLSPGDRIAIRDVYERISRASRAKLRVVEIGSALGRGSTQIAGELVKRNGGILYCVDPWISSKHAANPLADPYYRAFLSNLRIFDLEGTVLPMRCPSLEAAELFEDGSLDAVFVDGLHEYERALADIDAYLPKIRKGGLMFGHDLHDLPSRFDRSELLTMGYVNNGLANYRNSKGGIERVDVHPGVILAVQDRFGDDVEHIVDSVVWVKQL
jgi:tetratricopeptide (TPR) repeat protein